jgi:hypothetical protein
MVRDLVINDIGTLAKTKRNKMLKKLLRNFGKQAFESFFMKDYLMLLQIFVVTLPEIIKAKSLYPLDKQFTKKVPQLRVTKFEHEYTFDLAIIDQIANEESFTFGLVRELIVNNCYFEGFESIDVKSLETVVDLGGNRGIFTTLSSGFAKKLIYVEVQDKYQSSLKHLLSANKYQGQLHIFNKYIGGVGSFSKLGNEFISMKEVFKNTQVNVIDFLKIDIEGAEFALFENADWLSQVRYIALELHPEFGEVTNIINVLKKYNFEVKLTTMDFEEITVVSGNELLYMYAKNKNYK